MCWWRCGPGRSEAEVSPLPRRGEDKRTLVLPQREARIGGGGREADGGGSLTRPRHAFDELFEFADEAG